MNFIQWLDRHKGTAALIGGFVSVTAGATWWLAKGGAVALTTSVMALSDSEIADTLAGLPEYHARVEGTLSEMQTTQAGTHAALLQIADSLETLRRETQKIVEWAPDHSQRLTDAVGGCYAGESCTVYFRGRRTQAGAGCVVQGLKPRLMLPDGREFPVRYADDNPIVQLTTSFETIESRILIPDFIPVGPAGVVVLTVYAKCPFTSESETVTRETFRLLIEINPPR